jgi:hypothetical protein
LLGEQFVFLAAQVHSGFIKLFTRFVAAESHDVISFKIAVPPLRVSPDERCSRVVRQADEPFYFFPFTVAILGVVMLVVPLQMIAGQ